MLSRFQRHLIPVMSSLVFLNVVSTATALEAAGQDVLEIYSGYSSYVFFWLPIAFVVGAQIYLTMSRSSSVSAAQAIGNWLKQCFQTSEHTDTQTAAASQQASSASRKSRPMQCST